MTIPTDPASHQDPWHRYGSGGVPGGGAPPYGAQPYPAQQYAGQPYPGQPMAPQLAGWFQRVLAALIDLGLVFGIWVVAIILSLVFGTMSEALGSLVGVVGLLAAFGFYFWQLAVQGRTGQIIGKKQIGIWLVRESNGHPVGVGLSIARYFTHYVDQLPCYLGFLWPLWDGKKQTFTDKILGTLVIKP